MYLHDWKIQQDEKNDSYKHVDYNFDYINNSERGVSSGCPGNFIKTYLHLFIIRLLGCFHDNLNV